MIYDLSDYKDRYSEGMALLSGWTIYRKDLLGIKE